MIVVRIDFVKDNIKKKVIKLVHCESRCLQADVLTKAIVAPRLMEQRELISLV